MNVTAVCRFRGAPGQEARAAEAWAFDLTYYFLRGVGEAPAVTYSNGVYEVAGLMTTTHPGDQAPVTVFGLGAPPDLAGDLDFCLSPDRVARLRRLYPDRTPRWDGREP